VDHRGRGGELELKCSVFLTAWIHFISIHVQKCRRPNDYWPSSESGSALPNSWSGQNEACWGCPLVVSKTRRGYARPSITLWSALSTGVPFSNSQHSTNEIWFMHMYILSNRTPDHSHTGKHIHWLLVRTVRLIVTQFAKHLRFGLGPRQLTTNNF